MNPRHSVYSLPGYSNIYVQEMTVFYSFLGYMVVDVVVILACLTITLEILWLEGDSFLF